MSRPPSDVLQAFGVTTEPVPIDEGRGLCFRAGGTVLKPSDDDEVAEGIARLTESLIALQPTEYRLSKPIKPRDHDGFVYKQWTAWTFLEGEAVPVGNFDKILKACRALNRDLATLHKEPPDFLRRITNRWTEADLVTWHRKDLGRVRNVHGKVLYWIRSQLDALTMMMRFSNHEFTEQLIHGDLTGNVLFDEHNPVPGIIDLTLYWRPAEYAEAIVIADGLIWHDQRRRLVELYGTSSRRLYLLCLALYWRILTFAIDTEMEWVEEAFDHANLQGAINVLEDFFL
ncbi:phosphotransferase family protein [Thelonectria olida]|uniref:Phosphotransferase family protein n=1 Tax=Thelonectria olida TaxID=1576542 RepID=A0A9P8VWB4_9HYPO|nr:phosphotransferase family protein [Thelonectria olida]